MKKSYWIIGVVVAVVVAVVVSLSMFLFGGDKFVGTWYAVRLRDGFWEHPYISEIEITKNGNAYLVIVNNHFHRGKGNWLKAEQYKLTATKTDNNCIVATLWGDKISLKYNEKDKTITFYETSHKKLDTSIEELKTETEPQMIQEEKEREELERKAEERRKKMFNFHFDDIKFKK